MVKARALALAFLHLLQIFIHGIGRQKAHAALDGVLAVFVIAAGVAVVEHGRKVRHVVVQCVHNALGQGVCSFKERRGGFFIHRFFVEA